MRKKKENKILQNVMIGVLILLLLGSVFTLFATNNEENSENITVYVQYVIIEQSFTPQAFQIPTNSTLYTLLSSIGVSFEQDGDIQRIGDYMNNFQTQTYWQIFINNEYQEETDLSILLNNEDYVVLYYGERLSFQNITITTSINNTVDSAMF
jgi:hypothetical protein